MKRPYEPDLQAEIKDVLEAGEAFKKRQAERQRQREETLRKMDAAILSNDTLPDDLPPA